MYIVYVPQPRYTQIDIEATPYYHVISRCVRRAFLCGYDRASAQCFDHRKGWVLERLAELSGSFAISINAYAVLSNHLHLVVRIDSTRARQWAAAEVVERYGALFPRAVQCWEGFSQAAQAQRVALWRARLSDLSWFMRCLNEAIARRANQEDGCTGHFWEGRFRSQALLDEAGLLTCMTYVDLNPIRAGLATSLGESDFTSIQQRLEASAGRSGAVGEGQDKKAKGPRRPELSALARSGAGEAEPDLPIGLEQYVELLVATASALRQELPGRALPDASSKVLAQVGIRSTHWVETVTNYHRHFFSMVGEVQRIAIHCARTDRDKAKGSNWAKQVFRPAA